MNLKEEIKKKFVLFALILLLITSIIFTIRSNSKLDSIKREVTGVVSGFEPSHECKGILDSEGNSLKFFCFSVTSSLKTCYTLPDKQGGKRCLKEPYWEKIDGEPIVIDLNKPNYKCSDGKELYCYLISDSKKTCYTGVNKTDGKRCLTEPYWVDIECPVIKCEEPIACPIINLTYTPCVQTCDGCGGGSSRADCPPEKVCANCEEVSIIAYIPNDDCTYVDKYFCDTQGYDANCLKDGTLEMPFNW